MKLKPLASLICIALAAGTLTGCGDVYDEPSVSAPDNGTGGGGDTTPPGGETEAVEVSTAQELVDAIDKATDNSVIKLKSGLFDFSSIDDKKISIDKKITLVGVESSLIRSESDKTVLTGPVCITIDADGASLSNLHFDNVEQGKCDISGASANAIINIGKVTGVNLTNVFFDGNSITENTSGTSDAWIYTRGGVSISDSNFENKSLDGVNNIIYLNAGSSAGRGTSTISNNTFSVESKDDSSTVYAVKASVRSNFTNSNSDGDITINGNKYYSASQKGANATITDNKFINFENEVAKLTESDRGTTIDYPQSTAIFDVFGDGKISGNTMDGTEVIDPCDLDPTADGCEVTGPEDSIADLNERIRALPALDDPDYDSNNIGTVTVQANGEYKNGTVVIDRPVNLVGEDGAVIDSSCTLIQRYTTNIDGTVDSSASTKIRNVTISNITFTGASSDKCKTNESGTSAATAIYLAGDTGGQIDFTGLKFETNADGKAPSEAWFYARGQFELTKSTFTGLEDISGVLINAGSGAARKGSIITDNIFTASQNASDSITVGVQIGHKVANNKLDVLHKDGGLAHQAGVFVHGNDFTGFDADISDDVSTVKNLAVYANDANDDAIEININDKEPNEVVKSTNVISDAAIDSSDKVNGSDYNTFN